MVEREWQSPGWSWRFRTQLSRGPAPFPLFWEPYNLASLSGLKCAWKFYDMKSLHMLFPFSRMLFHT